MGRCGTRRLPALHAQRNSRTARSIERQCISGRCQPGKSNIRLGGIGLSPSQLRSIPHVRLIGCGTSLHACEVGQLAIEALARLPAVSHTLQVSFVIQIR